MRPTKAILATLIVLFVTAALIPADAEACGFFRRLFGWGEPELVPAPEISPGVPVYPEATAYYPYTAAYVPAPATVYYRRPVTTYYPALPVRSYYYSARPVRTYYYSGLPVTSYYAYPWPTTSYYYGSPTTAYYAGPGCSSSLEAVPAPLPGPDAGRPGAPQTYAPEEPPAGQQQQYRQPSTADEPSGSVAPAPAPESEYNAEPQQAPAPSQPGESDSDAAATQAGRSNRVELIAPQYTITALPTTPRTLGARNAAMPDVQTQRTPPVLSGPSPKWVPVARSTSVAKR